MSAMVERRLGPARLVFLSIVGIYFFVPLLAMGRFALQRVPVVSLTWGNLFEGGSAASAIEA